MPSPTPTIRQTTDNLNQSVVEYAIARGVASVPLRGIVWTSACIWISFFEVCGYKAKGFLRRGAGFGLELRDVAGEPAGRGAGSTAGAPLLGIIAVPPVDGLSRFSLGKMSRCMSASGSRQDGAQCGVGALADR